MSDEIVTFEIPRRVAEEVFYVLETYVDHHTEDGDYNGEPEVISMLDILITVFQVDYSADDIYAGGAE
jgi:hypothetical protein